MDSLDQSPLWPDIRKVLQSGPNQVRYEYRGVIHTDTEDFDIMKIVTLDTNRDYLSNVGDHLHLECMMSFGDYIKRLYPKRNNLEVTIYRRALSEVAEQFAKNSPIDTERYKAIFLVNENPNTKGSEYDNLDKNTLDLMNVVNVQLQLMNLSLEPLRIKTVGGVFRNVTQKKLILTLLAGESMKVMINGKPSVDGLDMAPPDNTETLTHVTIPQGTLITALPTFLQEKMNGIYTSGIGTYLQMYKNKRMWFVYPLYNTSRFEENVPKAIIYAVPRTKLTSVERTFKTEPNLITILATSGKQYTDDGETGLMNGGSGFRMPDARTFMKKPADISGSGPSGSRAKLNHEVAISSRADGLNYAPVSGKPSSNPFAEYSKVVKRNGARVDVTWQNSDPREIYPGMPVKYVFVEGKTIRQLTGVVLSAHSVTQLDGEGVAAKSHITTTQLTLFVQRLETK